MPGRLEHGQAYIDINPLNGRAAGEPVQDKPRPDRLTPPSWTGRWKRVELQQPVSLEAAQRGWKAIPVTGEG